jgi:hypothetical protein
MKNQKIHKDINKIIKDGKEYQEHNDIAEKFNMYFIEKPEELGSEISQTHENNTFVTPEKTIILFLWDLL